MKGINLRCLTWAVPKVKDVHGFFNFQLEACGTRLTLLHYFLHNFIFFSFYN